MSVNRGDVIEARVHTSSRIGIINIGDHIVAGEDLPVQDCQRWVKNGLAFPGTKEKAKITRQQIPVQDDPTETLTETQDIPTAENTRKEIMAWLDAEQVDYSTRDRKNDLLQKVRQHLESAAD